MATFPHRPRPLPALLPVATIVVLLLLPLAAAGGDHRASGRDAVVVLTVDQVFHHHSVGVHTFLVLLVVDNTGTTEVPLTLDLLGLPQGWTWEVIDALEGPLPPLPGGSQRELTLRVSAPDIGAGEYGAYLTLADGGTPLTLPVPLLPAVQVHPFASVEVVPGVPRRTYVALTNLGNGIDSFSLEVEPGSPQLEVRLPLGPTSAQVPPGVDAVVELELLARAGAMADPSGTVVGLTARSTADPTAMSTALSIVRVAQQHRLEVDVEQDEQTVAPGEPAFFHVVVSNLGNGEEPVALVSEGMPPGWTLETKDALAPLSAGSSWATTVALTPPQGAAPGDHLLSLQFEGQGVLASANVRVTVESTVGMQAWFSKLPPSAAPGQEVTLALHLRSTGTADIAPLVRLDVPAGWTITGVPEEGVPIAGGGERSLAVPRRRAAP